MPPTGVGTDSATLNGNLGDLGTASPVDVFFVWGTTPGGPYPNETTPAQAMTATGAFSEPLSSLAPGTTYYFQAKAVGDGTDYGLEMSLSTEEDADDSSFDGGNGGDPPDDLPPYGVPLKVLEFPILQPAG